MKTKKLLADISRDFFQQKNIRRYRMKNIVDMNDDEVISKCHWYCEENNLIDEWIKFRAKAEAEFLYCPYLQEYIDDGLCYDLQMITGSYIKPSALPEIKMYKDEYTKCCSKCKYGL